jgi:hypothetical protein
VPSRNVSVRQRSFPALHHIKSKVTSEANTPPEHGAESASYSDTIFTCPIFLMSGRAYSSLKTICSARLGRSWLSTSHERLTPVVEKTGNWSGDVLRAAVDAAVEELSNHRAACRDCNLQAYRKRGARSFELLIPGNRRVSPFCEALLH